MADQPPSHSGDRQIFRVVAVTGLVLVVLAVVAVVVWQIRDPSAPPPAAQGTGAVEEGAGDRPTYRLVPDLCAVVDVSAVAGLYPLVRSEPDGVPDTGFRSCVTDLTTADGAAGIRVYCDATVASPDSSFNIARHAFEESRAATISRLGQVRQLDGLGEMRTSSSIRGWVTTRWCGTATST